MDQVIKQLEFAKLVVDEEACASSDTATSSHNNVTFAMASSSHNNMTSTMGSCEIVPDHEDWGIGENSYMEC